MWQPYNVSTIATHSEHKPHDSHKFTLRDKVAPRLMKLYFYTLDLVQGVKWFVDMLCDYKLQCTYGVWSNTDVRRTQI
jgi:hypothetical protein